MDTPQRGPLREPTSSRRTFCTSCGQPSGAGRFCAHCGSALDSPATGQDLQPESASPQVPSQPVTGPEPDQPTAVLHSSGIGGHRDDDVLDIGWVEDDPPQPEAPAGSGRRRTLLIASAAVTAVAVAGVLVAGYVADSGIRTALAGSTRDFNTVVTALAEASESGKVAAAADTAGPAADRIDGALRRLGATSGAERNSVRDQLAAERDVLLAVAKLSTVGSEPLATWGGAHDTLSAALDAERESRGALARHQADAAGKLADTGVMLSKVTVAVGPALVEDATDQSIQLLQSLKAVSSTADLRKLGDAAAPEQAAVKAAAKALPAGDGKQVLTGYAAALGALAELSTIDAERTAGWPGTRAALAQTFGQVSAAAGSTGGANVRVVLDSALGAADKVVGAAAAAIADWKAKTDAAVKAREVDTEALASYSSFFRSQVSTYEQLRQDLSAFTDRVEDPNAGVTYYEGYQFLSQAAQDRRNVRDLLVGMDVPAGVRDEHREMVSAIDRATSAVQSAYDGLAQSEDCYDCPSYRDTPGWRRFQSESDEISKAYSGAMQRWEAAAAAEKVAITNRPLPTKPQM